MASGRYFAGTGFWDTFRALYPLLTFVYPEVVGEMLEGLQNCWKEAGWLPEWSNPGLASCMIGLAVGRNADGSFNAAFDPYSWGGDFTEGNSLHYSWCVFHEVPGLIAAMGGRRAFVERLEGLFQLPPKAEYSYYGKVIHEIREMQLMNFGQYAHGNQPVQHAIYLFALAGAPERTRHWAHEVMNRLYRPTPDGYCGDEDNGQTSAWYVWSALGMYPVNPAAGEYVLGAPLFRRAEVRVPGRLPLTIESAAKVEGRVSLDGRPVEGVVISRSRLVQGGHLKME